MIKASNEADFDVHHYFFIKVTFYDYFEIIYE